MSGERIFGRQKPTDPDDGLMVRGDIVYRIEAVNVPTPFTGSWRAKDWKGRRGLTEEVMLEIPVGRFPQESVFPPEWLGGDPEITHLGPPLISEGSKIGRLVKGIRERVMPLMPPALVATQIAAGIIPGPPAVVRPIEDVFKDQLQESARIWQVARKNEIEGSFLEPSPRPPESPRKQRTPTPEEIRGSSDVSEVVEIEGAGMSMGEVASFGELRGNKKSAAGVSSSEASSDGDLGRGVFVGEGVMAVKLFSEEGLGLIPWSIDEELKLSVGESVVYLSTPGHFYAYNGFPQVVAGDGPNTYIQICGISVSSEDRQKLFVQQLRVENEQLLVDYEREVVSEVGKSRYVKDLVSIVGDETGERERVALVFDWEDEISRYKAGFVYLDDLTAEEWRRVVYSESGDGNWFAGNKMAYLGDQKMFVINEIFVRDGGSWRGSRFAVFDTEMGEQTGPIVELENWGTIMTPPSFVNGGGMVVIASGRNGNNTTGEVSAFVFDGEPRIVDQFFIREGDAYNPLLLRIGEDEYLAGYGDSEGGVGTFWGQRFYKGEDGQWSFWGPRFVIADAASTSSGKGGLTLVGRDRILAVWNNSEGHGEGRVLKIDEFVNPVVLPTNTPVPTETSTSTPTNTPVPTETSTSTPTNTPVPTETSTSTPTNTPVPTETSTSTPTNTPPAPVFKVNLPIVTN